MRKSISVEHLDISNNPLSSKDITEMLNAIKEPSSLKMLSLTHVIVDEKIEKVFRNNRLTIVVSFNGKLMKRIFSFRQFQAYKTIIQH